MRPIPRDLAAIAATAKGIAAIVGGAVVMVFLLGACGGGGEPIPPGTLVSAEPGVDEPSGPASSEGPDSLDGGADGSGDEVAPPEQSGSSGESPVPEDQGSRSEDGSTEGDASRVAALGLEPAPTGGLVTTTGVPVAHLARTPDGDVVTTPCGATTTVKGGTPIVGVDVVLDPGHGGPIDTGAVGANGLVERDLNLEVAEVAIAVLAERGIGAALTRTADYAVPLPVRAAFADTLGAKLMISIHHNAPTPGASSVPGTEVFVQQGSAASAYLGGIVHDEIVEALSRFDIAWSAAPDAGVLLVLNSEGLDAYGMIRRPATPTVLAELGYLSNPVEADLFATRRSVRTAGIAIADAVQRTLDGGPAGSPLRPEPRVFDPDAAPGADVCEDPPLE